MDDNPRQDRGRKGIFGVKHSKKRPMMFSFTPVRGDEWPTSSDDSDEDFDIKNCPRESDDGESIGLIVNPRKSTVKRLKKEHQKRKKPRKRKKEKEKQSQNTRSKRKRRESQPSNGVVDETENVFPGDEPGNSSWDRLPTLILQKIFYYAMVGSGAVPFLLRMSKVSRTWRHVASLPVLWKNVNLDTSHVKIKESKRFTGLEWLIKNRFSKLEDLNLCNWSKLNQLTLETIIKECPTIKRLVLSGCNKLGSSSLEHITDGLENLIAIDISNMSLPGKHLTPASLSRFLKVKGRTLRELNLSNNELSSWPGIFSPVLTVDNSMPNLEHLDLSNCLTLFSSSLKTFPVEAFHAACPNLEILSLAGCVLVGSKVDDAVKNLSSGFPKLRQLSFPVQSQVQRSSVLQQDIIERILKTSVNLQLLDIRGRTSFTDDFSQNLPCTAVEYLYIGNCDQTILPLCDKWKHSLKTVHMPDLIVKGHDTSVADVLPSLKKMENLDLSGTDIDDSVVSLIVKSCPDLQEINLTRCRNVRRGIKQTFRGERLQELVDKMETPR